MRRWLATFGPATLIDLTWWSGLGVTRVRAALAALGAAVVGLEDGEGWVSADDLDVVEDPGPWVAFLPSLDPTAMGWKERSWYVGGHEGELFDRNGNIGPTVWSDGRVVGGWTQSADGTVRHELLEDVGADTTTAIEKAAAAVERWLTGVVIKPRFPTPLDRRLRS